MSLRITGVVSSLIYRCHSLKVRPKTISMHTVTYIDTNVPFWFCTEVLTTVCIWRVKQADSWLNKFLRRKQTLRPNILVHEIFVKHILVPLQWRHNERDGVSDHQPHDCLLNRLFRRVTGLCEGNSPVTDEFLTQRASNAENVSIWWGHHAEPIAHIALTLWIVMCDFGHDCLFSTLF